MPLTKAQIQEIIDDEIVVDCYEEHEINCGWAIYMDENIHYPFAAEYQVRKKSGKKEWQKVTVVDNHTSESNYHGGAYFVEIEINDLIVLADLDQLRNIDADEETLETLQVWRSKNSY
ncbi:MAG: calcium-binding protein [Saprospiraceae bacterium]